MYCLLLASLHRQCAVTVRPIPDFDKIAIRIAYRSRHAAGLTQMRPIISYNRASHEDSYIHGQLQYI